MPHLIPFVEQMLGVPFDTTATLPESAPPVPPPVRSPTLLAAIERLLPPERQ